MSTPHSPGNPAKKHTPDDHVSTRMLKVHEQLDDAYAPASEAAIQEQLAEAGARLADGLNSIWPRGVPSHPGAQLAGSQNRPSGTNPSGSGFDGEIDRPNLRGMAPVLDPSSRYPSDSVQRTAGAVGPPFGG